MGAGLADVRDVIAGTLRDVEAISTSPAVMQGLLDDLQTAELVLSSKLRRAAAKHGKLDDRFTGAQALAMQQQVTQAIDYVKGRLAGRTKEQAAKAIDAGVQRSITVMEGLEKRFSGIVQPMRLREAAQLRHVKGTASGAWARQFPTSVDRYGDKMLGEFEEIIRAGLVSGSSMDDIIAAVTGHGGPTGKVSMAAKVTPAGVLRVVEHDIPEGLFTRHKYWAERLVRTEMLKAYNGARQAALEHQHDNDFPGMKRKILAVLDKRTAPDSIAVHGQIRGIREHFVDGAGRSYLYPPARPNDRETVIPWRTEWEDSSENLSEWEKVCIGEGDAETEAKLERTLRAIAAGKTPNQPKPPRKPMERKKKPTFEEDVEASFRKRLRNEYGVMKLDDMAVGNVVRDHTTGKWHAASNLRDGVQRSNDAFDTREEAVMRLEADWNRRAARAAQAIKPWDETAYRAAVTANNAAEARQRVRGLLYREGVLPLDALLSDRADLCDITGSNTPGGAIAVHYWEGNTGIRPADWAKGKSTDKRVFHDHLTTMVHEELHGSTKYASRGFYMGAGATVEEVTVEMAARHITSKATGVPARWDWGAYQPQIDAVLRQISHARVDVEGSSNDLHLHAQVVDAAITMRTRRKKVGAVATPGGIIDQFVGALKLKPAVRKALKKRIQQNISAPR